MAFWVPWSSGVRSVVCACGPSRCALSKQQGRAVPSSSIPLSSTPVLRYFKLNSFHFASPPVLSFFFFSCFRLLFFSRFLFFFIPLLFSLSSSLVFVVVVVVRRSSSCRWWFGKEGSTDREGGLLAGQRTVVFCFAKPEDLEKTPAPFF